MKKQDETGNEKDNEEVGLQKFLKSK